MTAWGGKIENISNEELRRLVVLDRDTKPVWRLVAAIEYKHGLSPAEFEDKYGISRQNVYTWLDRFEERGLDAALHDESRSGRPPKLTAAEREQFEDHLQLSPDELGYDSRNWTPELARNHLEAEFDVEYSRRHVQRLLDELAVS